MMMLELEYRQHIQNVFDRIQKSLDGVDPDLVECEQSLGSMSLTLSDKSRCILSSQPSVRQLWLALAARGIAYHFDYDAKSGKWMDDKGKGVELITFLEDYIKEVVGLTVEF